MISQYLEREVRGRLVIARDMALSNSRDWDTISTIADGLDLMFAATVLDGKRGAPVLARVSAHAWYLTGYWASELEGRNPSMLMCRETNMNEVARFVGVLEQSGYSEAHLVAARKNGETYGSHILACMAPSQSQDWQDSQHTYYSFICECSITDCP